VRVESCRPRGAKLPLQQAVRAAAQTRRKIYDGYKRIDQTVHFFGKTIVITGGAGILGSEMACALAGCGANVAILDRNLDSAQGVLKRMGPCADQVAAVSGDVTSTVRKKG
jgi:NADP-dependent 3-hydroxy acid dehydrogenase YdfG